MKTLLIPLLVGDLQFVQATHNSPYGLIASHWQRDARQLTWQITIPPNSTATVWVPARTGTPVTESDQPVDKAAGVKLLRRETGHAVLEVSSGSYRFAPQTD